MRHVLFSGFLAIAIVAACNGGNSNHDAASPKASAQGPGASPPSSEGATSETNTTVEAETPQDASAKVTDDEKPSGPPRVDFIGRFDTRSSVGPRCGFPGCRIVARFDGTSVSVRLAEFVDAWMAGGPSEWDVTIDGVLQQPKLVLTVGTNDYVLAKDLPAGEHVVELYKRSEAQNGTTQFIAYDFGDGTLLAPPVRKKRRIEMIGDSQPAAFGIEGVPLYPTCPDPQYGARFQNFHRSMGTLLANELDAELYGTVYSGKGIVKNIYRPDTDTMPKVFDRALPVDPNSKWDFSWVPDAVVIMIGGNDFAIGNPVDDGPATLEAFSDGYTTFVTNIRTKYPQAHVFLATSPSVYDHSPAGRNSRTNIIAGIDAVVSRRSAAGDTRVYAVAPPIAQPTELTGCMGHGNPEYHQRVASDLAPVIRAKTGW